MSKNKLGEILNTEYINFLGKKRIQNPIGGMRCLRGHENSSTIHRRNRSEVDNQKQWVQTILNKAK